MSNAEAPGQNQTVTISVNGRDKVVPKDKISYDQVVALAYPNADFDKNTYKVTYFHQHQKEDLTLTKGQSVEAVNGMSFTVVQTIRS